MIINILNFNYKKIEKSFGQMANYCNTINRLEFKEGLYL